MKITKKQLRRIIKEEKQKLLVEMSPIANAERSVSSYADQLAVDQATDGIVGILQTVERDSEMDLGDDLEAKNEARNAAILVCAQAFQAADHKDVYAALISMLD